MPKVKKAGASSSRHDPLAKQLEEGPQCTAPKKWKQRKGGDDSDDEADDFVPAAMSRKIIQQAREQQQEIEGAAGGGGGRGSSSGGKGSAAGGAGQFDDFFSDDEGDDQGDEEDGLVHRDGEYVEEVEIDEADEAAMRLFMSSDQPARRTLGDIIFEKIQEKEAMDAAGGGRAGGALGGAAAAANKEEAIGAGLNPKVVEVYTDIGKLMSRYRSGKVPKAFKIIPNLQNWEEILFLTNPDAWSPMAMRVATRLFASNLNAKMAQRFYGLVLLPAVRDDIAANKKLNYHYYMALKKSVFKPSAFYRGILLPLCDSRTCTLREAIIVGSVIAKVSIPLMHSAAALLKLAQMRYAGANSLFIKILLNKKYSMPYRVIDALVQHFLTFLSESRKLPVIWHQSLLVFAQRYKHDLSQAQKDSLKPLLKHHHHFMITPEVRRELFSSRSRGEIHDPAPDAAMGME